MMLRTTSYSWTCSFMNHTNRRAPHLELGKLTSLILMRGKILQLGLRRK